jgi:hypothetical protein
MTLMKRALLLLATALVPSIVSAQDAPKIGLTMAAPSAIGILWQVTDYVALRPEVTWTRTATESSQIDVAGGTPVTNDDNNGVGVALGALLYVGRHDAFRPYVVPRFSYTRSSISASANNNTILGPTTSSSTSSAYQASGGIGGQYTFGRHFGVFGEAGLAYTRTNVETSSTFMITQTTVANGVLTQTIRTQTTGSTSHANAVSTRTAVGAIIYF